jgi:hypothetical protein
MGTHVTPAQDTILVVGWQHCNQHARCGIHSGIVWGEEIQLCFRDTVSMYGRMIVSIRMDPGYTSREGRHGLFPDIEAADTPGSAVLQQHAGRNVGVKMLSRHNSPLAVLFACQASTLSWPSGVVVNANTTA